MKVTPRNTRRKRESLYGVLWHCSVSGGTDGPSQQSETWVACWETLLVRGAAGSWGKPTGARRNREHDMDP